LHLGHVQSEPGASGGALMLAWQCGQVMRSLAEDATENTPDGCECFIVRTTRASSIARHELTWHTCCTEVPPVLASDLWEPVL